MTNNLSYNVCIKSRGDGKSYRLMEEMRKFNAKQANTQKTC